jgi:CO/xanthine dehydrogenase FAD-binding subunit
MSFNGGLQWNPVTMGAGGCRFPEGSWNGVCILRLRSFRPNPRTKRAPVLDLNTVAAIDIPRGRSGLTPWQDGDAWLGGGTWLFSEPQTHLRRLIDLSGMGWPPLTMSSAGLEIAATCTIAELNEAVLPDAWIAAPLIGQCCRALLASFKIWNMATVGGNICLGLPAGSMTSLTAALDGVGTVWTPDGLDRRLPIVDLVIGANENSLRAGEVLRSIHIPAEALMRRCAFRQISLTRHGRSGALLIGTLAASGAVMLTVTASVPRPIQFRFDAMPDAALLADAIERKIPPEGYYDDMHGRPDWRRHVTLLCAEEIRRELADLP